jgi:hypothetical protein
MFGAVLMPDRTPSPEQRARQQLRDIRADLLQSITDIDTHPEQTAEIFARHRRRVAAIVRQGRQQPRITFGQARRQASRDLPLVINLLWSAMMVTMVILVSWLTGWEAWPLALPLAFWVIVGSFVWTVGVPFLLFVACLLFTALLELHLTG